MCRGMSSCPWGSCGGSPGRELVGFLWGHAEAFGGSRSLAFGDLGLQLSRAASRLSPRGWPAVDCPGYLDSRPRLISGAPDRDRQLTGCLLGR